MLSFNLHTRIFIDFACVYYLHTSITCVYIYIYIYMCYMCMHMCVHMEVDAKQVPPEETRRR